MRPVQFILITLLIGIIYLYFSRLRSGLLDRVLVLLFAIGGIAMVAVPDVTNKLAGLLGVGRGADLFMYLALVALGFFGLVIYSKLRSLEASISQIARAMAAKNARRPTQAPPGDAGTHSGGSASPDRSHSDSP